MNIHVLHHVHLSIKHGITLYLEASSHEVTHTNVFENHTLPPISDIDWLIIMGGPMSSNDEEKHPWLIAEQAFIKEVIDAGKLILAVCLGAQLVAKVLGAKVTSNTYFEFGWHKLTPSKDVNETFLANIFNQEMTLFHSHGETFDIPSGAKRIASSEACKNQGFVYDNRVVAIQFHPEITPELANLFASHLDDSCKDSPFYRAVSSDSAAKPLFTQSKRVIEQLLMEIEENLN
ncbi:MAG: type 1 glutamine amidotransferase [Cycloclasticus sp.]